MSVFSRKLLAAAMLNVGFLFVSFFAFSAFAKTAKWPAGSSPLELVNPSDPDPFVDTLLGQCLIPRYPFGLVDVKVNGLFSHEVALPSGGYARASLKVFLQKNSRMEIQKAPLMVVLPGIFTRDFDNNAISYGEIFYKKGYNVLLIPNPWTRNYMRWFPSKMGNIPAEAEDTLFLIASFQDFLKTKGALGRTQLLGASYGALLGAAVNELDSRKPIDEQHIDGQVLLVAPAADLTASMAKIDQLIADNLAFEKQSDILDQARFFTRMCQQYQSHDFKKGTWQGDRNLRMAQALVSVKGFQHSLRNAVADFDELRKVNEKPRSDGSVGGHELEDAWYEKVNFSFWIGSYAPELLDFAKSSGRLFSHWLEQVNQRDPNRVLVVSSENDFVNEPADLRISAVGEQLLMLKSGGHLGFMSDRAFHERMVQVFEADL